jgi:glycerol-3-phosphate dehydrogenase
VKEGGQVIGAELRDEESGRVFKTRAAAVVNATGVFADELRRKDDPGCAASLEPSRGVHLVLPREFLPGDHAIMVPHTDDGRVLFVIPWHGRTLVGTTDTEVKTAELEPHASDEDIGFILRNAGRYLAREPRREDILSVFAGLRPLARPPHGAESKKVSREHSIEVAKSGLVTVTGGKWTTYRRMADEVLEEAIEAVGLELRQCITESLPIHGYDPGAGVEAGLPDTRRMYGTDRVQLEMIERADRFHAAPMHANLPLAPSEVIFAVRHEMACSVEDVLARRTRSLLLDARASIEVAHEVARLMGRELGWTGAQVAASEAEFVAIARGYIPA